MHKSIALNLSRGSKNTPEYCALKLGLAQNTKMAQHNSLVSINFFFLLAVWKTPGAVRYAIKAKKATGNNRSKKLKRFQPPP